MGLKKNSPGCKCCAGFCYDCGELGKFNEVDVTISDIPSLITTNFQKNITGMQRVTQTYQGLEFCNQTVRLVSDPTRPDELCIPVFRNEEGEPIPFNVQFDVTWSQTIYVRDAFAPNQCSETTVESTSSGTLQYTMQLSCFGFSASPDGIQPSGYAFPSAQDFLPFLDVNHDARICAGDSQSSLFDSGICSTAGDFTYRADTSPILV